MMYRQESNRDGSTKHSRHCTAAFGRWDKRCHRCVELIRGAAPRKSGHAKSFAKKLQEVQRTLPW